MKDAADAAGCAGRIGPVASRCALAILTRESGLLKDVVDEPMDVEGVAESCSNGLEEPVPPAARGVVSPAEQPVRVTAAKAAIRMEESEKLRPRRIFLSRVEEL